MTFTHLLSGTLLVLPTALNPTLEWDFASLPLQVIQPLTLDDAWTTIHSVLPDAVIGLNNDEASAIFFDMLTDEYGGTAQTPIRILVSDRSSYDPNVDLIIPPVALPYLNNLLQPYIALRMRNTQLAEHNARLHQDLEYHHSNSEELDVLKSAIIHNVSHELRTPLLQVKSAIALLSEELDPGNRLVELAKHAAKRLELGVHNVTILNELLHDSLSAESPGPASIPQMVQSARRNLSRTWPHKDIIERVQWNFSSDLPLVHGDQAHLIIVLQLLLDNALKFSSKSVVIAATRLPTTEEVEITIQDSGIGIPTQKIPHIFAPFYQVDASSTRRYGGMGIGLTIVQFILDRHQAPITVRSVVGQGTTITFSLPIAELVPAVIA
jgi:signal transduction histidine kinase